jgi:glutamyl-tRNA reductase
VNILCAGINHHIAPVEVRERFSVQQHEVVDVLKQIREIDGLSEAVVVSTCNRVEFYTAGICPARSLEGLRGLLTARAGVEAPLYHHDTPTSVRHLFRVASGLDSMVLGETEILGQVKQAYAAATEAGSTSRLLNRLFQSAFRVAKAVRSDTGITRGATSVGSVAVELAGKIFGDLSNHRVMILGAGDTSERTARSLVSRGVKTVIVSNRTFERAAQLAAEIGGMAIHFDNWHREFDDVDILISSTSAPHALLDRKKLEPVLRRRGGRPLFLIDLAVPRDIDPDVNSLDGVFLYDIDSLQDIARRSLAIRQQEVEHCERIINHHVGDFVSWLGRSYHIQGAPL